MRKINREERGILFKVIGIHMLYLLFLYAVSLLYKTTGILTVPSAAVPWSGLLPQLAPHMLMMLAFPVFVILVCGISLAELRITSKNLLLCAVLLLLYGLLFALGRDYSAGSVFRAAYLLFSIGLGEELFFRGWSYSRLKSVSPILAAVVSGAFWGAGHAVFPGVMAGEPASVIVCNMFLGNGSGYNALGGIFAGACFILLLELGGNLCIPILAHALMDLPGSGGAGIVILVLVFLYLFLKNKAEPRRRGVSAEDGLTGRRASEKDG